METISKSAKILYTSKTPTMGGREHGVPRSSEGRLDINLSSPGCNGIGTNPEQLFTCGVSTFLLAAFICLTIQTTTAQSIKNEVQIIESAFGIEKKHVVEQAMGLSGLEASKFWSIYEDYEDKRRVLGEERLFLIHDYIVAYPSITDAKASEITLRYFRNDEAITRLHKRYYRKVKKALSPLKATQFVQVERYIENAVRLQVQTGLPFIGEMEPNIININDR